MAEDKAGFDAAAFVANFDHHTRAFGENIDAIYRELPSRVEHYAFTPEGPPLIVKNKHGDSGGVRGAAWLWREGDPEGLPK